jgi:hypothetical protein
MYIMKVDIDLRRETVEDERGDANKRSLEALSLESKMRKFSVMP